MICIRCFFRKCKSIIYRAINSSIKKDIDSIFFIPHFNCITDNYDVRNYKSDNVLCLFNAMLIDSRSKGKKFYLLCYSKSTIAEVKDYCLGKNANVELIDYNNGRQFLKCFFKSSYIFTDEYLARYPYRVKQQKIICLSYYGGPFKAGLKATFFRNDDENLIKEIKSINESYDIHMSLSDMCSWLVAENSGLSLSKFLPLGFPRNDIFFKDTSSIRHKVLSKLDINCEHIISYVPTHRDYENKHRSLYNENDNKIRSIFGPIKENEWNDLNIFLEKTDSIILVKLHPEQNKSNICFHNSDRIFVINDFQDELSFSLQESLAISDLLIADYTSTVYDFLCTNRPIVYYCYDYDTYANSRGLFLSPIEPFCAGPIAENINSLIHCLDDSLIGNDSYKIKRDFLRKLLIKFPDGDSTNRIIDWFYSL